MANKFPEEVYVCEILNRIHLDRPPMLAFSTSLDSIAREYTRCGKPKQLVGIYILDRFVEVGSRTEVCEVVDPAKLSEF